MNQVAALRKQQNAQHIDKQSVTFLHSSTRASPSGMINKPISTKRNGSNGESMSNIATRKTETNVTLFHSSMRICERDDREQKCYDSLQSDSDSIFSFSNDSSSFYSSSEDYSSVDSSERRSPSSSPVEQSRESIEIRLGPESEMDIQRSHDAAHHGVHLVFDSKDYDDSNSESGISEITWSENSDVWLSSSCTDEESLFFQSRLSCTGSYSSWFKDDASTLKRQGSASRPTSWTIQVVGHLPANANEITFKVFPNDCPYPSCLLLRGNEIVECVQTLLDEDHKLRRGKQNQRIAQTFKLHFKASDVTAVIERDSILESCRSLLRQLPSGKAIKERSSTKLEKVQSPNSDNKRHAGTNAKVKVQKSVRRGWRWLSLFRCKKNPRQCEGRA